MTMDISYRYHFYNVHGILNQYMVVVNYLLKSTTKHGQPWLMWYIHNIYTYTYGYCSKLSTPKMDGFPTKPDHFCGSFGTLILTHSLIYICVVHIYIYIYLFDIIYIYTYVIFAMCIYIYIYIRIYIYTYNLSIVYGLIY